MITQMQQAKCRSDLQVATSYHEQNSLLQKTCDELSFCDSTVVNLIYILVAMAIVWILGYANEPKLPPLLFPTLCYQIGYFQLVQSFVSS